MHPSPAKAPSRAPMRFPEARAHDPTVQAWLDAQPGPLGALARRAFALLRDGSAGHDPRELLHDGMATACLGDAAFAYVAVYRAHANLGFFHATALPDPAGLLQGTGRFMRHVTLRPGAEPDADALQALVRAAVQDMAGRVGS